MSVFDIAGLQPWNGKRTKHSLTHRGLEQGSRVTGFAPGEAVKKWFLGCPCEFIHSSLMMLSDDIKGRLVESQGLL